MESIFFKTQRISPLLPSSSGHLIFFFTWSPSFILLSDYTVGILGEYLAVCRVQIPPSVTIVVGEAA